MKRVILCFMYLMSCCMLDAQYVSKFKMNYDGTFTTQDGKRYDVVEVEGMSATDLFDLVKKNIALAYRSPKDVESNVDDKIICIYGYAPNCTYYTAPGVKFPLTFNYTIKFQFKDEKIRVDAPNLYEMRGSVWETLQKVFRAHNIYSKNGVLSNKDNKRITVTLLEEYFNGIINEIINGNEQANEDW